MVYMDGICVEVGQSPACTCRVSPVMSHAVTCLCINLAVSWCLAAMYDVQIVMLNGMNDANVQLR